MPVRRYMVNMLCLVAIGVVCRGHDCEYTSLAPLCATVSGADFLVRPYLQLGDITTPNATIALSLLWHTADIDVAWLAEYRIPSAELWTPAT